MDTTVAILCIWFWLIERCHPSDICNWSQFRGQAPFRDLNHVLTAVLASQLRDHIYVDGGDRWMTAYGAARESLLSLRLTWTAGGMVPAVEALFSIMVCHVPRLTAVRKLTVWAGEAGGALFKFDLTEFFDLDTSNMTDRFVHVPGGDTTATNYIDGIMWATDGELLLFG